MDHEDHKFIQMAMKHIKKGAFTKQALKHHETPMEYAKEVLEHPEQHTLKTRKRAQFAVNIQPKDAPIHEEMKMEMQHEGKKARKARGPSAWNKLVKYHMAMVPAGKSARERMLEANAMAKKAKEAHGSSELALEAVEKPAATKAPKKRELKKKD